MRNKFILLIIPFLVLSFFTCSIQEEDKSQCLNPPELVVRNSSQYLILSLIVHDTPDYSAASSTASNLATNEEVKVDVPADSEKYFTFIRYITSTSNQEIAVTTQNPIPFEGCKSYKLHLLEEDFLLQ